MNQSFFNSVAFLISAYKLNQLPQDKGKEVAFSGRSNVGKSSLINAVCHRRGLVRVSKTPGRTQALNVFEIDAERRLVDLPGYGFAKVPVAVQQQWHALVETYLQQRNCLCGLVVIMDCRHPLQPIDWQMLNWVKLMDRPILIALNKADKLSKSAVKQATVKVTKNIQEIGLGDFQVTPCAATRGSGIETVQNKLIDWLG